MELNLHYHGIVAKFVANKTPSSDGCPFMEFSGRNKL
jgi:hypothetical protein